MTKQYLSRVSLRRDAPPQPWLRSCFPMTKGTQRSRSPAALDLVLPRRSEALSLAGGGGHGLSPGRNRFLVLSETEPRDRARPVRHRVQGVCAGARSRRRHSASPSVPIQSSAEAAPARQRSQRCDVVMDALEDVPKGKRADARREAMERAGRQWLEDQGQRHGFALDERMALRVDGYEQLAVPRRKGRSMRISRLDFDGALTVLDPRPLPSPRSMPDSARPRDLAVASC